MMWPNTMGSNTLPRRRAGGDVARVSTTYNESSSRQTNLGGAGRCCRFLKHRNSFLRKSAAARCHEEALPSSRCFIPNSVVAAWTVRTRIPTRGLVRRALRRDEPARRAIHMLVLHVALTCPPSIAGAHETSLRGRTVTRAHTRRVIWSVVAVDLGGFVRFNGLKHSHG